MRARARVWSISVLLACLAPGLHGVAGQSLLGTSGLGLPLEPLDARSRALGSEGVGLPGGILVPSALASATGLLLPTVNFTMQPHWGSGSLDGESLRSQGMRFPLLGLAYPVGEANAMVTLTFGSYMDQRWEVEESGTVVLDGDPTPVTNTFRSDGGISALMVGWSQRLNRSLAVSLSLGLHTGSVTRTYRRSFDSLSVSDLVPFSDGGKWRYNGPAASIGAVWDPAEFLRFGGSVSWSGDLDAEPTKDTRGDAATFPLPTVFRMGASGILAPGLSLSLGLSYADWTTAQGGLDPETVVGGVWSLGGGIEWQASGLGGRTLPLRLGIRRSDLPFSFDGKAPTEMVYSGGIGLNFTQAEEFVLAGVDLSLERGSREAGALKEEFWRSTMTFRVSGW